MSQRAEDMTCFLLLIIMYGLNGEECKSGYAHLTLTNSTMKTSISFDNGHNVTVLDTSGRLSCQSTTNRCYIECTEHDFFSNKNFTEPEKIALTVNKVDNTTYDFSINQTSCTCTVVDCLPAEISKLLTKKESEMKIPNDMRNILNIKSMCTDVIFHKDVLNTYIRVEKAAINCIVNMTIPEQSKHYYHEDLSIIAVKINLSNTIDSVPIAAPSVFSCDEIANISIPVEAFKNEIQNQIGIVTYNADQHLKVNVINTYFTSKLIRIEVPGRDIANLINPLKMKFKINYTNYTSTYNLSCQFYDEKGDRTWKKDGCNTTVISDDVVECSCDHMTPFAVLLVDLTISEDQWKILSYISYTGCSLSAFFSASTVLMFIFNSNARAEVSSSIHVSLSGALFLLNMSFMFSEWAATWTAKEVCVFVAVTIHYSLLCSFTWMAVEALHLYLLLIRVFNIYIRHYMFKLSLVGWGVPAVIVGSLLSATDIYGVNKMTLSNVNITNQICWIKKPLILYSVNIFYFSIIFLFNLGILITVSRQIFKLRHVGSRHEKMHVWKDTGTVLGLMCLLGTTWGLAFLSSGYTNYTILYLFCILNTTQGERCYEVPTNCKAHVNIPLCIEVGMRNCSTIMPRIPNPDYFSKPISLEETVKTIRGYVIHISEEAIQRSIDGLGKNSDTEVTLIVHRLSDTFFRVSSSLNTKKRNDPNRSGPILHGQSVLGVWLGEKEVHNLTQRVQLRFINTNQTENGICVYWHFDTNGKGNWRTDGCNTIIDNGDFVCSCNRLSFFAVIINHEILEVSHIAHLNYISYVGSALSIAFIALLTVMFLCQRKKQCENSVIIHMQLSGSLFLLHFVFLRNMWFSGQIDLVCQALGLLLHWCLLATFTWTTIGCFHLYLLLVRAFNIHIKRYLLKLSLVGWGVPFITVMICGVTKVYGKYTFYMDKESLTVTPLCWITTRTVSYITVTLLGLVIFFNTVILGVVLVKMCQLRSPALQNKDHRRRVWKEWVFLLGLCCVLGVPWVLAFSTYGPLSLPSLYAFTILNSFQCKNLFQCYLK
ncbi:hypothetical protein Q8A67_002695 [Cirrhinus molitorella]|uniref:Uncharacterized protein n=1 Tax=Cirrhinus molitorella TaxID=172907 RepID=A0AA88Q6U7_9TELE|nr:hypothetical protein Q8A67_002695 [Cirrhinus molitorella]